MSTLATLVVELAVRFVQAVLAFYGFWLVLRTLRPVLPGAEGALHELEPLACDLTDPFVEPVARWIALPRRVISGVYLLVVVGIQLGLGRLPDLVR